MLTPTINFEDKLLDQHVRRALEDKPIGHFSLTGIDDLIGGIHRGRFTIIAGQPGVSKSTLIGQLADDAAALGFISVVNTLELAPHQFICKSIMRMSATPSDDGAMPSLDNPRVTSAIETYRRTIAPNLCFVDAPCTAIDLGAEVARIQQDRGQQVILFQDYLQIMPSGIEPCLDERLAIKSSVAALRNIANAHDIPVIAISSINRTSYGGGKTGLECLGGCNAIEYSADTVLLLAIDGDKSERETNLQLVRRPLVITALKNRYAPLGSAGLELNTSISSFTSRRP